MLFFTQSLQGSKKEVSWTYSGESSETQAEEMHMSQHCGGQGYQPTMRHSPCKATISEKHHGAKMCVEIYAKHV